MATRSWATLVEATGQRLLLMLLLVTSTCPADCRQVVVGPSSCAFDHTEGRCGGSSRRHKRLAGHRERHQMTTRRHGDMIVVAVVSRVTLDAIIDGKR